LHVQFNQDRPPVSVPVMVAGGIALGTGTAAANIGYWETRGWIKW